MQASEVIALLASLIETHGDLPIRIRSPYYGECYTPDEITVQRERYIGDMKAFLFE